MVAMTTPSSLQELARQVRSGTLEILAATQPEWLTYAPHGTSNHILWHAGHALWLQDVLCIKLLTGHSELPNGWSKTFGMNCRPLGETASWPGHLEMIDLLNQQLTRILTSLALTNEEYLQQPADQTRGPDSVASRIIHGLHDEARHSGEMYLLFKLARNQ